MADAPLHRALALLRSQQEATLVHRRFAADAASLPPRMLAKHRAGAPKAGGVERALVGLGASAHRPDQARGAYLDRLLPLFTAPFRRAGLYAFTIGPHAAAVRIARPALPYPRRPSAAAARAA